MLSYEIEYRYREVWRKTSSFSMRYQVIRTWLGPPQDLGYLRNPSFPNNKTDDQNLIWRLKPEHRNQNLMILYQVLIRSADFHDRHQVLKIANSWSVSNKYKKKISQTDMLLSRGSRSNLTTYYISSADNGQVIFFVLLGEYIVELTVSLLYFYSFEFPVRIKSEIQSHVSPGLSIFLHMSLLVSALEKNIVAVERWRGLRIIAWTLKVGWVWLPFCTYLENTSFFFVRVRFPRNIAIAIAH